MYTASFAFSEAIWEAGITYCFVNLGSDHPCIIEAMVKGQREANERFPRIVTCPDEGLGAAVHKASTGRAPVFVFAGMSPFTLEGEMRGPRTGYIHCMQDVPDQKAILGQQCRYTVEIMTGTNVKQMVKRALQFATSDPRGSVYLCGAREVMEADISPYSLKQERWDLVKLGGLPGGAAESIAEALSTAKKSLIVMGYSGRNHGVPEALMVLADTIKGLCVHDTGGSDMCFPAGHPGWLGLRFGVDDSADGRFKADFLTSVNQILVSLESGPAAKALAARDQTWAEKERRKGH
ncbi:Acetolactate synthase large subunit or other thiamine pyrophosphate-requiring enzyme [Geosmithia morbida]|uniref:Acetolactate synthase large subunit or other thiamine pyrophosphate-requiring enzyme n=1 Tax=Geosmithia morbida TaxID=1094350 RepID=A0A9P4YPF5_9HYPO|nr:Acetolactate synthase large subunit or other thiamine pyrophosphate-requiring enzyme [Geosmithia morbida]KAF4119379.1 Acetolactate synthase large subunit or other thiamine pyrophosphate-requiring enzyme [Geosmithia morbida]